MSAINASLGTRANGLYRMAGLNGGLLGALLLVGAYGHLVGVWAIAFSDGLWSDKTFLLILPGVILAVSALVNLTVCYPLWRSAAWALRFAFTVNVLAAIYLAYLLQIGIPDHPIGFFLALVACQVIVLGAIQAGLVWPHISPQNERPL